MDLAEYSRIAEAEELHWWYRATRALARQFLAADLRPGAKMLDAGCGTGGNSAWWLGQGPVTGVDVSPEAIRLARANHPALNALQGDLMELPLEDQAFDLALVLTALAFVSDDGRALHELHRVLRPGGVAFLLEPANPRLRRDHDTVTQARRRYALADLQRRVEGAGLTVRRATYAYSFLLPPALGLAALHRVKPPNHAPLSDLQRDRLGWMFSRLARAERRVLERRDLRWGLSCIVVAERRG